MATQPQPALTDEVRERVTGYIQHQATKSRAAIVEMVTTNQQKYIDAIAGLDEARASAKPAPEEWSIRELTNHVITAQNSVAKLVNTLSRGVAPKPSDPQRAVGMMKADAGATFASMLDDLRAANARMLAEINAAPESPDLESKAPHPFFGPLNCMEWAMFQYVHDADHIQHAGKILAVV